MKAILFALAILFSINGISQQPSYSTSEIHKQIEKIGVLNRVLYFAAHPDDENTRLIAYLSKGQNVETAYFSLTRGDGGQNLIGDEKGALLGVIRTQELLEARRIDGAKQYFSRAIDFGYSKNATETLKHWEEDSLLADAVLVIRKFKPDVIVTRFPPDKRAGHGHHSVSAMIAELAFEAAANPNQFPESAAQYGTWQVQKLYWNASTWWDKTIPDRANEYTVINIGAYDSQLGVSYSEISSHSRSQHQSQGFGMEIQRGDRFEYLKLIKGDSTHTDVLQQTFRTWNDVENGKAVQKLWSQILTSYDATAPQKSIDALIQLHFTIQEMPENPYRNQKAENVKNIIAACGGLWMEFSADKPLLVQSTKFEFSSFAISQSNYPFELTEVRVYGQSYPIEKVLNNTFTKVSEVGLVPSKTSAPYWLEQESQTDMFTVNNRSLISQPENNAVLTAQFVVSTSHGDLIFERPLIYKWTDRVRGELYRQVAVVEALSVKFDQKVSLATDNKVQVWIRANEDSKNIQVQLNWGNELSGESEIITIPELKAGQSYPVTFLLDYPFKSSNQLYANVWKEGTPKYTKSLIEIAYPHIQTQVILPQVKMTLIKDSIIVTRKNIGYIVGSGDEIPVALKELGCKVTIINPAKATLSDLQKYDGIVIGIRAYNKVQAMKSLAPVLNQYVFEGGFVMMQYNTNRGLVTDELGPYPFKLSRVRVTEEDAKAVRLQRNHPVLMTPNKITDADFENWVQERGLYFANEWDEHYEPIIGWNDTDEKLAEGSLLVTNYGKGQYVFTGISFFRQLPAGVHGAYKLFANLMSYGKPVNK
jgi:LmbE family N-acetylglucosaminyl deacetylase